MHSGISDLLKSRANAEIEVIKNNQNQICWQDFWFHLLQKKNYFQHC
jgi:hypothetical protein